MNQLSSYTPLSDAKSVEEKREEIRNYFLNTYELYEKVFELLKDESVFYKKSEPTRHPMIFYFGHTATFFINKLINMKIITQRVNPEFESIFAVGVDEMSWDDVDNSRYSWPKVQEVREYRAKVKKIVERLILEMEFTLPISWDSPMWVILMGIEHERIHIETSLVLHRQMPLEFIQESPIFQRCRENAAHPQNKMIDIEAKEVSLGVDAEYEFYAWDNEYGKKEFSLRAFQVAKYLVSNGEYMEFVKEKGYEDLEYWDAEGRAFLERSGAKMPPFWLEDDANYLYRTLSEIIDMPLDWPVEVNALEAEAFCRYKSKKEGVMYQLPSEAEYRAIYEYANLKDMPDFNASQANLNFAHYASSTPVTMFEMEGICDVVGNVWQWSKTPIRAFDGFRVHEAYDDFTVPTLDEKHALILGSSWASSGNLITKNSRYAFRKHFYQNAGFRYVITENKEEAVSAFMSDAVVQNFFAFEYVEGEASENFRVKIAKIATSYVKSRTKALDLGCATGRSSFELAREFDAVEGIDFSARFIQVGVKLRENGEISLGESVTLDALGYKDIANRVSFWQGDANNLKPNFHGYDLIMATHLEAKISHKDSFLEGISKRLKSEGIFAFVSHQSEQESAMRKKLDAEFIFVDRKEVKYKESVSELSIWRKR